MVCAWALMMRMSAGKMAVARDRKSGSRAHTVHGKRRLRDRQTTVLHKTNLCSSDPRDMGKDEKRTSVCMAKSEPPRFNLVSPPRRLLGASSSSSWSSSSPSTTSSIFVFVFPAKSWGPRVSFSPSCYCSVRTTTFGQIKCTYANVALDNVVYVGGAVLVELDMMARAFLLTIKIEPR